MRMGYGNGIWNFLLGTNDCLVVQFYVYDNHRHHIEGLYIDILHRIFAEILDGVDVKKDMEKIQF